MNSSFLINTPLQRGEKTRHRQRNRFNGFRDCDKTAEAVGDRLALSITPLKRGVNESVRILVLTCSLLWPQQSQPAETNVIYQNDFQQTEVGKVPEDFLVLEGAFAVKAEDGNKFLELPGAPLDSFGALFGPTESAGMAVSARVYGTAKGRRFPTFGVGLNGVGGYRLQVSPAKKLLELYKGDEVLASAAYNWESGSWTMLRLQVRKAGESWKIEGKVWKQGAAEPAVWILSHEEKTEPTAGRASIWGSPYATTPIRYDDLLIQPAKGF